MSKRRPTRPGTYLKKVLKDLGVTQEAAAEALCTSRLSVNEIINGKRRITTYMALKLAYVLGTSAQLWIDLQTKVDLFDANDLLEEDLDAYLLNVLKPGGLNATLKRT